MAMKVLVPLASNNNNNNVNQITAAVQSGTLAQTGVKGNFSVVNATSSKFPLSKDACQYCFSQESTDKLVALCMDVVTTGFAGFNKAVVANPTIAETPLSVMVKDFEAKVSEFEAGLNKIVTEAKKEDPIFSDSVSKATKLAAGVNKVLAITLKKARLIAYATYGVDPKYLVGALTTPVIITDAYNILSPEFVIDGAKIFDLTSASAEAYTPEDANAILATFQYEGYAQELTNSCRDLFVYNKSFSKQNDSRSYSCDKLVSANYKKSFGGVELNAEEPFGSNFDSSKQGSINPNTTQYQNMAVRTYEGQATIGLAFITDDAFGNDGAFVADKFHLNDEQREAFVKEIKRIFSDHKLVMINDNSTRASIFPRFSLSVKGIADTPIDFFSAYNPSVSTSNISLQVVISSQGITVPGLEIFFGHCIEGKAQDIDNIPLHGINLGNRDTHDVKTLFFFRSLFSEYGVAKTVKSNTPTDEQTLVENLLNGDVLDF